MFVSSNLLRDLLPYFKRKLKAVYDEREVESIFVLFCEHRFALGRSEALTGDKRLTESELLEFRDVVNRLQTYEPIQYILGETEFYGFKFKVNSHVLIPRPETEELVDLVVKKYQGISDLNVLDIGTGSGCIPITLSKRLNSASVSATDISAEALQLAKENAELNLAKVDFKHIDLFSDQMNTLGKFELIISNPPYIPIVDKNAMHRNVLDFEPHLALFVPDEDAVRFYKRILDFATSHLTEKGEIYFELHPDHGDAVLKYATSKGFKQGTLIKDLSGKNRFAVISR